MRSCYRIPAMLMLILAALQLAGCVKHTMIIKVNRDGTGFVRMRYLADPTALAGRSVTTYNEQRVRDVAAEMGEGVSLVSSKAVEAEGLTGYLAEYAFQDITKLQLEGALKATPTAGIAKLWPQFRFDYVPGEPSTLTVSPHWQPSGTATVPVITPELREKLKQLELAIYLQTADNPQETNAPYVSQAVPDTTKLLYVNYGKLIESDRDITNIHSAATNADVSGLARDPMAGIMIADPATQITVRF